MSIANPFLQQTHKTAHSNRLKRIVTFASVTVALILIFTKLWAYLLTDSVSLLSSLMDSTVDAIASIITLISVRHAMEPADEQHRYGHGKLEPIAAMAQSVFIAGSATFILFESMHRFVHPQMVQKTSLGISVMVLSIVLTLGLVTFQKYVIKQTKSVAIDADHLHYKGDLLMNAGVILALVLGQMFSWPYFDPIFALLIAALLLNGAWEIGRSSYDILMDKELPLTEREKVFNIVLKHKSAESMHDLRTRSNGQQVFIEFHLELNGEMTLNKAHDVTEEIEALLFQSFPNAEILIHQEPAGIEDHRLDEQVKK